MTALHPVGPADAAGPVCSGCGFAWGEIPVDTFGTHIASLADRFDDRLAAPEARLRRRPAPAVWSPLEYACHVRDMVFAQRERVYLALVEDGPSFARMYREERVVLARYDAEAPADLRDDLRIAFRHLTIALSGRTEQEWARRLIYNFPVPTERDLTWLGRHTLHECEHHLADIDAGLAANSGSAG